MRAFWRLVSPDKSQGGLLSQSESCTHWSPAQERTNGSAVSQPQSSKISVFSAPVLSLSSQKLDFIHFSGREVIPAKESRDLRRRRNLFFRRRAISSLTWGGNIHSSGNKACFPMQANMFVQQSSSENFLWIPSLAKPPTGGRIMCSAFFLP